MELTIRRAKPSDALFLTSISFGAMRYWNYPEEYLEIWHDELTITEEYIEKNIVFVAQKKETIIGYCSLIQVEEECWKNKVFIEAGYWLEHLFIRPAYIRSGIGSSLIEELVCYCSENDIEKLNILSDCNANGFYDRVGAIYIKSVPSNIEGREVSLFEFHIPQKNVSQLEEEGLLPKMNGVVASQNNMPVDNEKQDEIQIASLSKEEAAALLQGIGEVTKDTFQTFGPNKYELRFREALEKNRMRLEQEMLEQKLYELDQDIDEDMDEDINEDINQDIGEEIDEDIEQDINDGISEDIGQDINDGISGDIGQEINEGISEDVDQNIDRSIDEELEDDIDEDGNDDVAEQEERGTYEYLTLDLECTSPIGYKFECEEEQTLEEIEEKTERIKKDTLYEAEEIEDTDQVSEGAEAYSVIGIDEPYNVSKEGDGSFEEARLIIERIVSAEKEKQLNPQEQEGQDIHIKTEKEKMLEGELYIAWGDEIFTDRKRARRILKEFNLTDPEDKKQTFSLLKELLGSTGEYIHIEPNFQCNYGYNIHIGDNFYAGYNCVILDNAKVTIGDNCILSPQVGIYTLAYPIDSEKRIAGYEYAHPITIGNNVWIGGGTVINAGVTIGNDVVIVPGSVITTDIPDSVIAGGNPARIIKEINQ